LTGLVNKPGFVTISGFVTGCRLKNEAGSVSGSDEVSVLSFIRQIIFHLWHSAVRKLNSEVNLEHKA
jgi:hypothetical protein